MESLSVGLSASPPPWLNCPRTRNSASRSIFPIHFSSSFLCSSSQSRHFPHGSRKHSEILVCKSSDLEQRASFFHVDELYVVSHLSFFSLGFLFPLSCLASEAADIVTTTGEVSNKINLEAIVVSVDEFFNKNPFFVAGVTFIWLFVVPLVQGYLRKYKFISAIDAFRKLRDDPTCQLLDIRDKKSLDFISSPNLKIVNKSVLQVEFREGDAEGFAKQVLRILKEPESTSLCILDSFDGNSMKVAELLVKNGFKEAYAIKGGIIGKKGWQEIQEELLPPSTHIYPKKKIRVSEGKRGAKTPNKESGPLSADASPLDSQSEGTTNGSVKSLSELKSGNKSVPRSSSPYPNYPDLKPPSSPTPSKPER